MPELQFLKTFIFLRGPFDLQNLVNFIFFLIFTVNLPINALPLLNALLQEMSSYNQKEFMNASLF